MVVYTKLPNVIDFTETHQALMSLFHSVEICKSNKTMLADDFRDRRISQRTYIALTNTFDQMISDLQVNINYLKSQISTRNIKGVSINATC
ncbi:hypothetical protein [Bacillus pumilus]|uniref:hypothetical protein n=1 Tax=Bacillus pumilus TaxID=1408 RepID=UPI0011A7A008|nr:hypothetical protein [Bacillus pumilus]